MKAIETSTRALQAETYPVPPVKTLVAEWQRYAGGNCEPAAGVYGAVRMPEKRPIAVASVDLCEVVRQTSQSVRTARGRDHLPIKQVSKYDDAYGEGCDNYDEVASLVCKLMNTDRVSPVDGIAAIAVILQSWRANGIYVAANTATLPGCELATFRFMGKHLPDSFDAILFPRNFNNEHPYTKGSAAVDLIAHLYPQGRPAAVIHIDDSAHHNIAFHAEVAPFKFPARTFSPDYPGADEPHPETRITKTPLEAFMAADEYLSAILAQP